MPSPAVTIQSAKGTRKLSAYLDWLQMLSGAALIIFMWTHLCLVSSVIISPSVMNAIAWFFEVTGLVYLVGPGIFLVFLTHFVLAARKIPFVTRQQTAMWDNAKRMHHQDTWLWLVQAGTAMVILIMGAAHMWVVLTDLPITAAKSAARIQGGAWLVFYLVLLPMVELHVGIGFYRIAVKWGFLKRSTRKGFHAKENMLTIILIGIGVVTLLRFLFLPIH
ncbi:MAG: succinate dehydrogenase/fumarate reductase cytochrome b subunit [Telmatospirillum sp.]|nr:succinate dehydrogenase/fumarate reductase cytochrome b subunit [Telmatospirillum sp.]